MNLIIAFLRCLVRVRISLQAFLAAAKLGAKFPFPVVLNGICKLRKSIKIGNPSQIN